MVVYVFMKFWPGFGTVMAYVEFFSYETLPSAGKQPQSNGHIYDFRRLPILTVQLSKQMMHHAWEFSFFLSQLRSIRSYTVTSLQ